MTINLQPRDYQQAIFDTTKDNNTLVVLPTGLGKTLIALMLAVHQLKKHVPSKILLLAPTKPLVEQHFEYFKKNIPELFADIQLFTGEIPAKQRKEIWNTAEIIMSTPQCIANDIQHQLYSLHEVSLLIIDEAHRCLKNYDYTKVVESYKMQADNVRILGLTASPGSDPEKIKEICRHLDIEEIEIRTRESEDVKNYLQEREFRKIEVPFPKEFLEIKIILRGIFDKKVNQLKSMNFLFGPANKISLLMLQNRLAIQATKGSGAAMAGMSITAQAIKISHAIELLETQTLSGLNDYLQGLVKQSNEGKSRGVQYLVKSPEFNAALISLTNLLTLKLEHPKVEGLAVLTEKEFLENPKSKIIVFTQFRETANRIVERLNQIKEVRSSVFIGQAKKSTGGLSQREQKQVIEDFKEGKINVLVATSIGEEGLDIPEVGAVIFYEPIPSAVRKIQRAGRTARLAPGKLIILITKDTRDEINHWASTAREKKMQKTLEIVKKELHLQRKNKQETKKDKTLNDFR